MNNAHLPTSIAGQSAAVADQQDAEPDVGEIGHHELNERHEQWLREQYLRDLETLDRIERQNDCFFDGMGQLHAERGGHEA